MNPHHKLHVLAPVLSLLVLLQAPFAPAQGPKNQKQISQVNLLRTRPLSSVSRLYGLSMKYCGASRSEDELLEEIGRLAGATYLFSIVTLDQDLYLNNSRFKGRIDAAFGRMEAAASAVENLGKKVPASTWSRLVASWNRFKISYTDIAHFWSEKNRHVHMVQAIELKCETTTTRVGKPVQLTVLIRYADGKQEEVKSSDVSWLLRPGRGVTVNSAKQFLAHEPGVYQVTAVYNELTSHSAVIRVIRRLKATYKRDLTGIFFGHKQNFAVVKSIACKVPDEAFDALYIRILDKPARIGDLRVYFKDGSNLVLWEGRHGVLEAGEYQLGSFTTKRKILRFDLCTQGQGGSRSKQVIFGVCQR